MNSPILAATSSGLSQSDMMDLAVISTLEIGIVVNLSETPWTTALVALAVPVVFSLLALPRALVDRHCGPASHWLVAIHDTSVDCFVCVLQVTVTLRKKVVSMKMLPSYCILPNVHIYLYRVYSYMCVYAYRNIFICIIYDIYILVCYMHYVYVYILHMYINSTFGQIFLKDLASTGK